MTWEVIWGGIIMFLWYLPIKFPHGLSGVAETSLKTDDAPKIIKLIQIYSNNS